MSQLRRRVRVTYDDAGRIVLVSVGANWIGRASLEAQGGEAGLAHRHPLGHSDEIAIVALWLFSAAAYFVTATGLAG